MDMGAAVIITRAGCCHHHHTNMDVAIVPMEALPSFLLYICMSFLPELNRTMPPGLGWVYPYSCLA
eukprot:1156831-Pelagomonas_calceolata.AAC.6